MLGAALVRDFPRGARHGPESPRLRIDVNCHSSGGYETRSICSCLPRERHRRSPPGPPPRGPQYEYAWDETFEALVALIVAESPPRAIWIVNAPGSRRAVGKRIGCILCMEKYDVSPGSRRRRRDERLRHIHDGACAGDGVCVWRCRRTISGNESDERRPLVPVWGARRCSDRAPHRADIYLGHHPRSSGRRRWARSRSMY
jgi:hypothetical protein